MGPGSRADSQLHVPFFRQAHSSGVLSSTQALGLEGLLLQRRFLSNEERTSRQTTCWFQTPVPVGKRESRPLVAAVGGTMSIQERTSGRSFLIDSGADECVFPALPSDYSLPQTTDLIAVNGSSIRTFGKRSLLVSFADGQRVELSFWIAKVQWPILCADFFHAHDLLIDIPHQRLISPSGVAFKTWPTSHPAVCGLRLPTSGPYESILEGFPNLLVQNFKGEVKHKVCHFIQTSGQPIHARPRWLDGNKL